MDTFAAIANITYDTSRKNTTPAEMEAKLQENRQIENDTLLYYMAGRAATAPNLYNNPAMETVPEPGNTGSGYGTGPFKLGSKIPSQAYDVVNYVSSHNGAPPQGYKGGRTFNNQPLNGGQKLPDGVTYREYDVNPYVQGQNRGAERVVIGSDGSAWYTNDHYHTFIQIK